MKKIINNVDDVVAEMVDGMVRSYPQIVKKLPDTEAIVRNDADRDKSIVGLVSGGGSGHEPTHAGYVGQGMLSAAVAGQVFTSPTPDQIYAAIKDANHGKGVFLIIKNYSGDVMNFDMAKDIADMDDIPVKSIVVDDDIAVENSTYTQGRRGVAGTIFVHKILGAAADQGADLDQIDSLAHQIVPNIKTIGVALSGATVPAVGKPGFTLADDEIEYGVGIHGEPGYRKEKLQSSKDMAHELLEKLGSEFHFEAGQHYAVLVNGMGATPLMEQYIFMNDVLNELDKDGVSVDYTKVGNFMTSLDMAGVSLTLMKLDDAHWLQNLQYPVKTIAWGA
ncbi:dihydroxyacetone kinase subunit DhaK [Lactobacillus selangorensis]|uniref:phosphoenolpyruvate--glycerone phosphotransferase n=1 Tax=Lactobacillus selangorensis TaxID=81857 RepID=A0A0R2G069_9LACO|nr:dihydroxyacetone kinase subunit DhaK [Lactobacillus selangorensis]KRN29277.1 dihydroxyacetone kinase subunit DhaK [Lactobacillus selangorensis]KRN34194.1 dihydroxyacetone kinase subunit DhaK [Lactobacillus selangorensis]